MLSPQQIQLIKSSPVSGNGQVSNPNVPMTPEQAKSSFGSYSGSSSPLSNYFGEVKDAAVSGAKKIGDAFSYDEFKKTGGNPISMTEDALKAGAGAAEVLTSPVAPVVNHTVGAGVNAAADAISNIPAVQKFANSNAGKTTSRVAEDVGNAATIAGTVAGGLEAPEVSEAISKTGNDISSSVSKNINNKVNNIASSIKDTIVPTESIDSTVGKIAQGAKSDIPSFKSGLENLDTSKVKTYSDLSKLADSKIKELSGAQDTLLSQDKNLYKVQSLATKVGDKAAAHNYVIDAVNQLKDFYTKTNDVPNLQKVNDYIDKLDPIKGTGLTLKDVNSIARMHGSDLSGYNANGELASGLTKQAAENTRQGLKNTVRNLLPDGTSKSLDKSISDIYTVRDLSKDMADKVNKLSQRLQNPNVLQKIGGVIGKGMRFSGVGDLASNLLGIEKVPGAKTLNPLELEAKLSKNLGRINNALKSNDTGFITKIKDMINHPD